MCCSVPLSLSVSTAASAGSELQHCEPPVTHTHTQPMATHRHRHTHKNAITVGESGFGVTFHCLSGSGPRPRQLAPPLVLLHFPQPAPSLSTPVVTLQLLSQSSLQPGVPNRTTEDRLADLMWAVWQRKVKMEGGKHREGKARRGSARNGKAA